MSQIIRLVGVLDDGADIDPRVPRNTARTIQFPSRSDVTIEVEVVTNGGVPVDLVTGSPAFTARFSIVRRLVDGDGCPTKPDFQELITQATSGAILDGTRNVLVFSVGTLDLRRFPPGRYFYDVSMDFDGRRHQLVRVSGLHIEFSIARA